MPRGNQALPNLLALRKNGVPARPLGIVLVALTLWLAQVAELSGQSPSPRQYGPNSVEHIRPGSRHVHLLCRG